jgi:GrpB-like predicted nucleotidyltransferase (UPF0157 family)
VDEIEIVDYDPAWPGMFVAEAERLRATFGANLLAIEHFGSTAVPGLASKPIIDILVIVRSLDAARAVVLEPLRSLDYMFWDDNPKKDRLFYVRGMPPFGARRTHHVHVTESGGELCERLLFRDYLRANREEADRYAELKRTPAAKHREDREAYTEAKSEYVAAVMAKAKKLVRM